MPGHTSLYCRGAVYYFRQAVPTDIKDTYPLTEEKFSPRTKDFTEAKRRCHKAAIEVDRKFDAHRKALQGELQPELTDEQIRWVAQSVLQSGLANDEEHRSQGLSRSQHQAYSVFCDGIDLTV